MCAVPCPKRAVVAPAAGATAAKKAKVAALLSKRAKVAAPLSDPRDCDTRRIISHRSGKDIAVCIASAKARDALLLAARDAEKKPSAKSKSPAKPSVCGAGPPPWECRKCGYVENHDSLRLCYLCGISCAYLKNTTAKPSVPPCPRHPDGIIVDIVGMIKSDRDCSCEEHA
jgi:hypothetical protein